MRLFPLFLSAITLILGFTFYGEIVTFNIFDTYYLIPAEVICFSIWLVITMVYWLIRLKNYALNK